MDGDKNKIHSSNSPTTNSTTTNPPTTNPPTTNLTSNNPTSISSSSSTDDSSDSEEDAKSNSTLLPPLQNSPTGVNNNKPAASSSAMPITDHMIQSVRSSGVGLYAFANRLEEIKNGIVQVGGKDDWYEYGGVKLNVVSSAITGDRVDILEALVKLGAGVESITIEKDNALKAACHHGNLDAVKFLFTVEPLKNLVFDLQGLASDTNLMAAVKTKDLAVVQCVWDESLKLLNGDSGRLISEYERPDSYEITPLHQTRINGSKNIEDFLLSKGFTQRCTEVFAELEKLERLYTKTNSINNT